MFFRMRTSYFLFMATARLKSELQHRRSGLKTKLKLLLDGKESEAKRL